MKKEHILDEIKRTAALNDGIALGKSRFFQETGIKENDWLGKIWARWSDAVKEAGVTPDTLQIAYENEVLFEKYAAFIRELGHIPVASEFRLKANQDNTFPSGSTFVNRLGRKQELIKKIIEYCEDKEGYEDVLAIALPHLANTVETNEDTDSGNEPDEVIGFVYMLKVRRDFKVGRSNSFDRRSRELKIQLPEQAETVHVIRTDDPIGIEAYWHKRFEAKRKNGEWFALTAADVKAFKRRKFM
jgi:Meiotically up-regulated gene 113